MAKYNKSITVNLGNYQTMRLEMVEAESFAECDVAFLKEVERLGISNFLHQGVKGVK